MYEKSYLNLASYVALDTIYQDYKSGSLKEVSDFDKFCIEHCKDIEYLLKEIDKVEEIKKLLSLKIKYCKEGEDEYSWDMDSVGYYINKRSAYEEILNKLK